MTTVDQLIGELQRRKKGGEVSGDSPVVWDSIERSWPVEIAVRLRNGVRVVVVNA